MAIDRREFLHALGATVAVSAVGTPPDDGASRTTNAKTGATNGVATPPVAAAAPPSELCFTSVRELAAAIRARKLSARELMTAQLAQIARVNPKLNAIVAKLDDERCLALADDADRRLARGEQVGALHGIPWAFKDLEAAVGFPQTRGSPIFRNFMPPEDSTLVARLRAAGVVPIGKTNVPEFGMGSHSYNKVYGTTLNPWDFSKTAGGSSGGAGVGVATGMLAGADGSDLGGSLRNPANFNNITAIRPTVGLVPATPSQLPLLGFSVKGPLARSVSDVAYLLSVMAGPDAHDLGCYPSDPALFAQPLERSVRGTRVAWCPDLGGLPLDRRVRGVLDAQRRVLTDMGCVVEDACPDFGDAAELFLTLRQWMSWVGYQPLLDAHRKEIKAAAIWEIESGAHVTSAQLAHALVRHGMLFERMRKFYEKYDFLACAVNQVPPFDANIDWPHAIDGTTMENYVSWMKSTYMITVTMRPSMSVPAGFTPDGLPVGIQFVGGHHDDFGLLQFGYAFEQATNVGKRRPTIATG